MAALRVNRPAKQESASQLSKPAVKLSEKPASKSESSNLQSKGNSISGDVAPAEVSPQEGLQTVEGYLVEASPDQIQATLDSLKTAHRPVCDRRGRATYR